jgi:HEPN domain-containing protein
VPQDRLIPGSPQEWLARARGDLALACAPLPSGGFYEDLCFHAQQAAEKALNAVYLHCGWAFRYVHDLEELITGLRQHGLRVPEAVEDAVVLTSYAFEARYPGLAEPVPGEEHRQAIELAQTVVRWAEETVERGQA